MFKESYTATVVRLGIAVLISALVAGCAARPLAVDAYLDALRLREQDRDDLAVEALQQALEAEGGFALAHSELGRVHLDAGELDQAAAGFQNAVMLDPWSFGDCMDLARVRRMQGRFSEAGQAYGRAAELAPESLGAQVGAAACYLKAGDSAHALAHAESARQMDDRLPEVLRVLGQAHEAQRDYERAMVAYRQWSELAPDVPDGTLAMAIVHSRKGEFEQARVILRSVLQKWPREAAAFGQLAYCRLKLGDTDGAIEMYENAISLEADNWESHRGLGVAYMVKSRQTADDRLRSLALRHWRQALRIAPDQPRHDVLRRLIKEHSTTENPLQGLDY